MAIHKKNLRGLQSIRTLSESVDGTHEPHRAYMKITCLEMEKARRVVERESAMTMVRNIDTRLQEIEAEKTRLLRAAGERSNGAFGGSAPAVSAPRYGVGAFKLKY